MRDILQQEISHTFRYLYKILEAFTEAQFNALPFEGSWTAGQVAEHIIKSTSGFPKLAGSAKAQAERPADEKTAAIKKLFLDLSIKMSSPEFILPSDGKHDLYETLHALQQIEKEMAAAAGAYDLALLVEATEMPGFGKLTVYEWGDFALTHAQRHTRQLENIFRVLNKKSINQI